MDETRDRNSRDRSPEDRRTLAVLVAGAVSALLFVGWLVIALVQDNEPAASVPAVQSEAAASAGVEPLREAFESFRQVFDDTAAAFEAIQEEGASQTPPVATTSNPSTTSSTTTSSRSTESGT